MRGVRLPQNPSCKVALCIIPMFGLGQTPQGASRHIAALMQEREDYEEAIRAQALRIQQLEADLAAANEQVEVQTLIG